MARSPRSTAPAPDPVAGELTRLVQGEHGDPHHVLGFHKVDGRTVVRAYRPDASAVRVLLGGGKSVEAEKVHDAGIFVADVPESAGDDGYRLEASYPSGDTIEIGDPYRFWPTLGELDLHLLGEGRHHDLWKQLGANHREHQGTWGTSFAVWAPNAKGVRVVGDWNLWDGRVHPMRSLGSSGVWELFVPDVQPGARYKFEILTPQGHLTLKADPMAFATEVPPGQASVVAPPLGTYQWNDEAWLARRAETDWLTRPISTYELHLESWRRKPE